MILKCNELTPQTKTQLQQPMVYKTLKGYQRLEELREMERDTLTLLLAELRRNLQILNSEFN